MHKNLFRNLKNKDPLKTPWKKGSKRNNSLNI